jgi:hypothetical protein
VSLFSRCTMVDSVSVGFFIIQNSMTLDDGVGPSSGGSEGISVKKGSETRVRPTFVSCSSAFCAKLISSLMLIAFLVMSQRYSPRHS